MSNSTTKTCTKCKRVYPKTTEYFKYRKLPSGNDGLYSWCKNCIADYQRGYGKQYYKDNKERILKRQHERMQRPEAKELRRQWEAEYRLSEQYRKYQREWKRHKWRNDPEYQEKQKEANRQWRQSPSGKAWANQREQNPSRRAKRRVYNTRRKHKIRQAPGQISANTISDLFLEQDGRCAYCGIPIYFDVVGDIHLEHIMPISRGGTNYKSNLCLTCVDCNLSKHNKTLDEWDVTMRP